MSPFRAEITRSEPLTEQQDDGTFERKLLGFCVSALLDEREQLYPDETRSWWARRLELSKSHVSKMAEVPSVSFIDRFDLALTEVAAASPSVEPRAGTGRRLDPWLSDFYAELRPTERRDDTHSVLRWFARYQPPVTDELRAALLRSEVALERCRMLDKSRMAEFDDSVRASLRELLIVVSGPYGASMVAHKQCAEIGLLVPAAFFDALEETLGRSPVGFRVLRTLDRFVKLWHGLGSDPKAERRQAIDNRLTRLLRRLGRASAAGRFIDPYPGAEWEISLARECLRIEGFAAHGDHWLGRTLADPDVAERGRLYAAWVAASNRSGEQRAVAIEALRSSPAPYLRRWGKLIEHRLTAADQTRPPDADGRSWYDALVEKEFAPELGVVTSIVLDHAAGEQYRGIRDALTSTLFSALVTPDGRLRRAFIEAIIHAGLAVPAAAVLDSLLGVGQAGENPKLDGDGLRETAIFLLARLRQPSEQRLRFLTRLIDGEPNEAVVHAAVWCVGDIWRRDLDATEIVRLLGEQGADHDRPPATRVAAANVLAIIAHQEAHEKTPLMTASTALESLKQDGDSADPTLMAIHAMAVWGTSFDPNGRLDASRLLTLPGLVEGDVSEQDDLGLEQHPVGL